MQWITLIDIIDVKQINTFNCNRAAVAALVMKRNYYFCLWCCFFCSFSLWPDKDSILRLWHFGFSLYTLLFRFCLQLWLSSRFPISHKFSKRTEQFLQLLAFNSFFLSAFLPFHLFTFSSFRLFHVCEFPFWLFVPLLIFVPLPIFVFFFHSSLPVCLV